MCIWLARLPVENHHPRPLLHPGQLDIGNDCILVVREDELLMTTCQRLTANSILGCPVVDFNGVYVNQIDMLDLVVFLCKLFRAHYDDEFDQYNIISGDPKLRNKWSAFFELDELKTARVDHVLNSATARWDSAKIPTHPAYTGCSSLGVIEQMVRLGSHRVVVLNDAGRVHGIISQSMLISLFGQHMERLGWMKDLPVSELVPSRSTIPRVVREKSLAINAFKLMTRYKIAELGVVDANGCLVGSISVSDLQGIGCNAEHFERLWYPVKQFTQDTARQPSVVLLSDTLETVIRRMEDGNIHVVFVVEQQSENGRVPSHIITQRDVLGFICHKMGLGSF